MKKRLCLFLTGIMLLGVPFNTLAAEAVLKDKQENSTILECEKYEDIPATLTSDENELLLSEITYNDGKYQALYSETGNEAEDTKAARIVVSYKKEIQVWYDNFNDITEYYSYKEYSTEYKAWCSGSLKLKKVNQINGRYQVTYVGDLTGII